MVNSLSNSLMGPTRCNVAKFIEKNFSDFSSKNLLHFNIQEVALIISE